MTKRWIFHKQKIAGFLLVLVFIALFVPYIAGVTQERLLTSVAILILVGAILLPMLFHRRAGTALRGLLRPRFVIIALLLPIIPSMVAVSFGRWYSIYYALLMSLVLAACQMILVLVPMRNVLRAFSQAGAVIVPMFFLSDLSGIIHSTLSATRLIPREMQPNALGFMFVGFILAFAWRAIDKASNAITKSIYLFLAMAASLAIFLASSRASMLAIACSAAWASIIWGMRVLRSKRVLMKRAVVVVILTVFGGSIALAARPVVVERGFRYTMDLLQLTSNYRGFGSGLSGRVHRWDVTLSALTKDGVWAFGSGYRSSSEKLGFSVDNGYLTIMYEMGVLGLIVILAQLWWCLRISVRHYIRSPILEERGYLMLLNALIVALLVNNIFDRYLFGIGNPFSVIGLFLLLLRRGDLSNVAITIRTIYPMTTGSRLRFSGI